MKSAVEALTRAAGRGVDVHLLLPGLSDVPLIRHAGHGYFGELLARGVRISEYREAVLHAKTLVADGLVSIVGSSNLDFRSFRFNAECNLVRTTSQKLAHRIACELATPATLRGFSRRPLPRRPPSCG